MSEQTVSLRLEADASMFKQELVESGKVADQLAGDVEGAGKKIDQVLRGFGDSGAKAEAMLKGLDTRVGELTGADRDVVIRANISQFENGIRQIESALGDPSLTTTEVKILVDRRNEAVKAVENLKEEIGELGPAAQAAGDEIERGLDFGALGGAVASAGLADRFNEATTSAGSLRAQLGLTGDEAREFDAVSKQVYRNNFGESMGHAAQATGLVHQAVGLVGDDLRGTTELVLSISDAFEHVGADANMLTNNLRVMKASWPGLGEERALDLIAHSFQTNGAAAEDVLDTIQEYSGVFAALGFSADDVFTILNAGLEDGARNTDLVAEAFLEMSNLIRTEGDRGQEAIRKMFSPEEAERLIEDFGRGGDAAREAFQTIGTALVNVKDPNDQFNLSLDLFGTKAEDIGDNLIPILATAMDGLADSTDGAAGAAKLTEEQYTGVRNTLEGLMREIETSALGTIGEVGVGIGDVAANAGIAILGFKGIADALPPLNGRLGTLVGHIGRFGPAAGLAGVGLFGLGIAINAHSNKAADARESTRRLVDAIRELGETGGTSEWLTGIINGSDLLRGAMADAGLTIDDLASALQGGDAAFGAFQSSLMDTIDLGDQGAEFTMPKLRNEIEALKSQYQDAAPALEELEAVLGGTDTAAGALTDVLGGAAAGMAAAASASDGVTTSLSHQEEASIAALDAVNNYADGLSGLFDPLFAAHDASLQLAESQAEVTRLQEEGKEGTDEYTEAQRTAVRDAISMESALARLKAGFIEEGTSIEDATKELYDMVDAGIITAAQADQVAGELSGVVGQANQLDGRDLHVGVHADVARAEADLNWVARNRIARIQGVMVGFTSRGGKVTESHDGGAVFKADGGSVFKGRGTDVVPAMLGTDEFVMRGEAVQRFGLPFMEAINAGQLPGGGSSAPAAIDVNITLDSGDGIIRYFRRRIKTEAGRSAEVFFRS